MNIGSLRHRVTIQQYGITRDDFGAEVPDWMPLATVWASVEDLAGKEYFAAQQVNAEVSTRIRIRYRGDIKPQMRVVYGARVLDIQAVLDPEGRRRELQLMCKEAVV